MSEWRYREGEDRTVEVTTNPGPAAWLPIAVIVVGLVVTLLAVFLYPAIQAARADACLDAGGSFDYERGVCDREFTRPGP